MRKYIGISLILLLNVIVCFGAIDFTSSYFLKAVPLSGYTDKVTVIAIVNMKAIEASEGVVLMHGVPGVENDLSLWVNSNAYAGVDAGKIGVYISGSAGGDLAANSSGAVLVANTSQHIGFVADVTQAAASKLKLYYNGQAIGKVDNATAATTGFKQGTKLMVGDRSWAHAYLKGIIEGLWVWNRALSPEEVAEVYFSQGKNIPQYGLIYAPVFTGFGLAQNLWDASSKGLLLPLAAGTPLFIESMSRTN